jgi:hypothetical protein
MAGISITGMVVSAGALSGAVAITNDEKGPKVINSIIWNDVLTTNFNAILSLTKYRCEEMKI